MAKKEMPSPELLRRLLRYEPETGRLFWRSRPLGMFQAQRDWRRWNTIYSGAEAFRAVTKDGYLHGSIFDRMYKAHRVIWAMTHSTWPSDQIDHINGNPSDNRLSNLRIVSNSENGRNRKRCVNNTSGVMGVYWHRASGKWQVQVEAGGVRRHLGSFKSFDAAVSVRNLAEAEHEFHPNHGRIK